MPKAKSSPTIDALARGVDLLEILAQREAVKLAELPALLGTSRATAFRVLKTLQSRGYVEHVASQSTYRLGPAAFMLANRSRELSVVRHAHAALRDLSQATGETVNLALFRAGHLTYADIVEGRHALRMSGRIGEVVPIHSTALGIAILAALPVDQRRLLLGPEPWEAYTERTPTTWRELEPEIELTVKRGYAVDNQQMDEGAVCVGAVIRGAGGEPIGGISVSGWAQRLMGRQSEVGKAVADWCARIGRELGFAGDGA